MVPATVDHEDAFVSLSTRALQAFREQAAGQLATGSVKIDSFEGLRLAAGECEELTIGNAFGGAAMSIVRIGPAKS